MLLPRLAGALLLLLTFLPATLRAQAFPLMMRYDLDGVAPTYCGPMSGPNDVDALIETVGSSTTVTAVTAGDIYAPLAVGDILVVPAAAAGGISEVRAVTAIDGGLDSLTIDEAIDWSRTTPWSWYRHNCGEAITSGWMNIREFTERKIMVAPVNLSADTNGLFIVWECKPSIPGFPPGQVYPDHTAAVLTTRIPITVPEAVADGTDYINAGRPLRIPDADDRCRVGLWFTADDAIPDASFATTERIWMSFSGQPK